MILKHFILSTLFVSLLWLMSEINYLFNRGNWSRYGYEQHSSMYALSYTVRFLYMVAWCAYVIVILLEWYYCC